MNFAEIGTELQTGEYSLLRLNTLNAPELEDYVPIYNYWVNQPEVNEFLTGVPESIEDTEKRLLGLPTQIDSDWTFVIKERGQSIGFCGLHKVHAVQGHCELEIFLGNHTSRGKGSGKAIVSCLCEFGFTQLEVRGIVLRVVSHNTVAVACYRSCGFSEVYRYPGVHERNGHFYDEVIMQLNTT